MTFIKGSFSCLLISLYLLDSPSVTIQHPTTSTATMLSSNPKRIEDAGELRETANSQAQTLVRHKSYYTLPISPSNLPF